MFGGEGTPESSGLTGAGGTPHFHRYISARCPPKIDRRAPPRPSRRAGHSPTLPDSTTNYCTQTSTLPTASRPSPAPALGQGSAVTAAILLYADTPQLVFSVHVLHFCLPLTLSPYLYIVPQTLTFTGSLVGDLEAVLLPALASQQFAEAAVRAVVGSAHGPAEGTQFATFGCADAAGDAIAQPTLLPFLTHVLSALSCRRQVETVTHGKWAGMFE